MNDYSITLASGVEQSRKVVGNLIHFRACSDPDAAVVVTAFDGKGQRVVSVPMRQGQKIQLPATYVDVRFLATAALVCNVVMGSGQFTDDRPNGTVAVAGIVSVDPVASVIYPRFSFLFVIPAVVAEYAHTEIHNPVGSGKTLYISQLEDVVSQLGYVNGLLIKSRVGSPPNLAIPYKSLNSGVDSVAKYRSQAEAGIYPVFHPFTDNATVMYSETSGIVVSKDLERFNVVLNEGDSFCVYSNLSNSRLVGSIFWEER